MTAAAQRWPTARRRRGGVDVAAAANLVAELTTYLSAAFALPTAAALWYGESPWPFAGAAAITLAAGLGVGRATRGRERVGLREGFLVVSLTWLVAAAVGALPYLLSGEEQLSSPIDAYFEAMSGFTTTGSSVLTDIPDLPRSLLLWRQLTQWLGGMGIIVLALAVLPRLRVGGRQLFQSEAPGPEVEPLSASIRSTARRLWLLYLALTVAEVAALSAVAVTDLDPEMTFFDALAHALTTMPTGGFSPRGRSLEEFGAATQWVVIAFMVLAGANFGLMYVALVRRDGRALLGNEEVRLYLLLLALAAAVLAVDLGAHGVAAGEHAVRAGAFQAVAIMTTTGYASADFAVWPALAAAVLVGLMFVGGTAASTAGSVKVVRHLLIGRILRRELDQTVHPEIVEPIRLQRMPVEERTVRAVIAFFLLYVTLFAAGTLVLMFDSEIGGLGLAPFEAVAAAATTLGNVGPALGPAGPMGSFQPFGDASKIVMILLMWLGRLEIVPVIVLFTVRYWRK
ncbi:MAG: TrkH family potassium uptake protein [Thermoleophilia bacterium]|nr:TrkH family potassium uptake protein [Thermoleophilia bacterium]